MKCNFLSAVSKYWNQAMTKIADLNQSSESVNCLIFWDITLLCATYLNNMLNFPLLPLTYSRRFKCKIKNVFFKISLILSFHIRIFPSSFLYHLGISFKSSAHVSTQLHGTKYSVINLPFIIRLLFLLGKLSTEYRVTRRRKAW